MMVNFVVDYFIAFAKTTFLTFVSRIGKQLYLGKLIKLSVCVCVCVHKTGCQTLVLLFVVQKEIKYKIKDS